MGVRGETYAYWYLRRLGYIFVARNYSPSRVKGELDLIGYDQETLVIVEVRTRQALPGQPAQPELSITEEKREVLLPPTTSCAKGASRTVPPVRRSGHREHPRPAARRALPQGCSQPAIASWSSLDAADPHRLLPLKARKSTIINRGWAATELVHFYASPEGMHCRNFVRIPLPGVG